MSDDKYTVTVYVAAPGTKLNREEPGATSGPGHMFYVISNGHDEPWSYGFAPVTQGRMDGPGIIKKDDVDNYQSPLYSRTMEISKQQYEKLNEFAQDPEKFGFSTYYKDARHNCVDFTWGALNHAGIERKNHLDLPVTALGSLGPDIRIPLPGHGDGKSAYRPARNVDDVKSISDPVPGSTLNREHHNPLPAHRNPLQHLLSDNEPRLLDDSLHPGHAVYRQAHEGVSQLNALHQVAPSDRDRNFAASLVVAARSQGLDRIDHVVFSDDASRAFVVQGPLKSLHGLDQRMAQVSTTEALHTPIAQSSAGWDQAIQQYQQQILARQSPTQQNVAQPPQHDPVMKMG